MKRLFSALFVLMAIIMTGPIVRAIGNSLSDHSAVPSAPQKKIATGDLWLHAMKDWSAIQKTFPMTKVSDGIYTVEFDTSDLVPFEFDEFSYAFTITNSTSNAWDPNGYFFPPSWSGNNLTSFSNTDETKSPLFSGNNGQCITINTALQGKFIFRLDTTGDSPSLTLLDFVQTVVGVSYDGASPKTLEGKNSWTDSFTITDNSERRVAFDINGEQWGGTWTGSDITLSKGAQPIMVPGPGIYTFTLSKAGDKDIFTLSFSKEEYVAPVTVEVSQNGGSWTTLEDTKGPWQGSFTVKSSGTQTLGIKLNGEQWGGVWTGSDIALQKGVQGVSVAGPGIFSYTISRDGDGFRLAMTKAEYVEPITSLTINGITIRQNAEENPCYSFESMEIEAGKAIEITDNFGNTYRAASDTQIADGSFNLTGSKGAKSNLRASGSLVYIFTATAAGRSIRLDVNTFKPSGSTVDKTLLDNFDGSYIPVNKETIWFDRDANGTELETSGEAQVGHFGHYKDIFLIGNGRYGASVIGGMNETVIFNDKSNFEASLDEGNTFEAWNGGYTSLGTLSISGNPSGFGWNTGHLVRQLDMTTGIVTYARHDNGNYVTHEYVCSGPYDVTAIKIAAGGSTRLSYGFKLGEISGSSEEFGEGYLSLSGNAGSSIVSASMVARVLTDGVLTHGSEIKVSDATWIYVICGVGTNYEMNNTTFVSGKSMTEIASALKAKVDRAADLLSQERGWAQFYNESAADHRRLFNAMQFDLDDAVNDCPTNELLDEYKAQTISASAATSTPHTRMFDILLTQFGRYINIAASRGDSNLPTNLQGLWADKGQNVYTPWLGDYHCNINLQMNYWPSEPTGIGETHMPLFRWMKYFSENKWRSYASKLGGKGWTHAMGVSPFGSSYQYNGAYPEGAAWNCTHIWQHYLFTLDNAFLAEYFDVLYGCCEYLEGCMTTYKGKKVLSSTYSPENGGGTNPAVHATQIAYQVIDATRQAALILGKNSEAQKLATLLASMHDGIDIGSNGLWCEWFGTNTNPSDDHRHLSHLMSLYPLDRVDAYADDSRVFDSAFETVLARGDKDGGENSAWNTAWKAACYARVLQGDLALRQIAYGIKEKGCIYNDLRIACKGSFQIDGSCGISGAVPEMLLQSHRGSVEPGDSYGQLDILPALPSAWADGSVKGLRAVGNFSVDIRWTGGKAQDLTVISHSGTPLRLRMKYLRDDYRIYLNGTDITSGLRENSSTRTMAPSAAAYTSDETVAIPTSAGDVVRVRYDDGTLPDDPTTGINITETTPEEGPAVYYNLQGIRVDNPSKGNIYIRRTGSKSVKVKL